MPHRFPLIIFALATILPVAACTSSSEPPRSAVATATEAATAPGNSSTAQPSSAAGQLSLFDTSVVHTIAVQFDGDDYAEMIAAFVETGEKDWIEGSVTIDGVTYERAGLRLKGNSSLSGLRGRNGERGNQQPGAAGDGSASTSANEPAKLPWLIRLDKFVDGQQHQGRTDIVVRSNSSQTALNEAVALDLLQAAGLASQQAVATTFAVNGSSAVSRLAIELPDEDAWQDNTFKDKGALYKAESAGDWTYRGSDPDSYIDVFDQKGGKKTTDMTPLIEFLDFINNADDATFAEELPERLDVESFARYLAMMELLNNFDDIDGPGNNSYLWYDIESKQFTVVPWDMNLAFGGTIGGGGQGGFTPGQNPGGDRTMPGGAAPGQQGGQAFPGQVPGGGAPGRGGMGGKTNPLVQRFHADSEFEALYQQTLTTLRAELFESGLADEILTARVQTLTNDATGLVDSATIESEAAKVAANF